MNWGMKAAVLVQPALSSMLFTDLDKANIYIYIYIYIYISFFLSFLPEILGQSAVNILEAKLLGKVDCLNNFKRPPNDE